MKHLILLFALITLAFSLHAQGEYDGEVPSGGDDEFTGFSGKKKNKEKKDLSRIKIGGDFGFALSQGITSLELSPLIGYEVVDDRIELGAGMIYRFQNYTVNNPFFDPAKVNIIGGRTYGRIFVWQGLFAQIEGEFINYRYRSKRNPDVLETFDLGNAFAGAGYRYDVSNKVHAIFSVHTNLIINAQYPRRYILPRIGFQVSL